jgi:predicted unusual protein kinase regulating ubiquinone biosynthesis (AarF/ABC1/UbiB family)
MEWVDGTKITNINELSREFDTKKISEYLVKSFILQTMDFGFFHADPHPGNIAVTKNGRLVFYDFGLVSKIPPEIQNKSRDIITYIFQKKTRELVDLFIDIGLIIPDTKNKFEITLFFDSILNYVDKNQNDDTLKQIILDKLSEERPFIIPGSFIFLAKTFTLLDGICQQLNPEFTFINYLQPYIEESVDINLSQIAFQSINMPSKINDISNTMYNLQQQRLELNKRFEQLYSNQYILFHLLMLYNLIITLLY